MPRSLDPLEEYAESASSSDSECMVSAAHARLYRRPSRRSRVDSATSRCYRSTRSSSCPPQNLVVVVPPLNFIIDHRQPVNAVGSRDRFSQGILMPLFPSVSFSSLTWVIVVHIRRCLTNCTPSHASSISLALPAFPCIAKSLSMELQCHPAFRRIHGSTCVVSCLATNQFRIAKKWQRLAVSSSISTQTRQRG